MARSRHACLAVTLLVCFLGSFSHCFLQRYPGLLGGDEGAQPPQQSGGDGSDSTGGGRWLLQDDGAKQVGGGWGGLWQQVTGNVSPPSSSSSSSPSSSHERMSLEFFDRVLLTAAETEFGNDEDMFQQALDFQWKVLQQRPTKAAPYLVCSRYAKGREVSLLLKEGLPDSRRVHTVHSSRANDAMCFIVHADYVYAKRLIGLESIRYVEPFPSALKISPGSITYSSQALRDGNLGGSASTSLKFAQLGGDERNMPAHTPAPTPAPTFAPRTLERAGPELIVTFSPGAKIADHVRFLVAKWKKILAKLGGHVTDAGDFQERFFWAAASAGALPHQHYGGRTAAWNQTLERVKALYDSGRTCGFEDAVFRDETDTHVVVGNLLSSSSLMAADQEEEQQHACMVVLNAVLASHPDVLSIQIRARYTSFNAEAAWIIQSGDRLLQRTPLWDLGLTGKGEIIGVSDTGLDDEGCYFYDKKKGRVQRSTWDKTVTDMSQRKVVQYVSFVDGGDFVEGHGTHVSASIAGLLDEDWSMHSCRPDETLACTGMCLSEDECRISQFDYNGCSDWKHDGSCDTWFSCPMHGCDGGDCRVGCNEDPHEALGLNAGMARDARIAFFDIADEKGNLSTPSDFNRMLFPPAYRAGARIHSNSWGINIKGYLFDDMKIDQYAYEHQDFLIIYAAGNYGQDGFHSIGSPGTTKNALTIGATESGPQRMSVNIDYVAKFSSRGPTYDGRLKPDVVAPGSYIYSARSAGYNNGGTCSYVAMAGTSMAAPIVAGTAALLRQYFKEGLYAKHLTTAGTCREPYLCRAFEPSAPLLKAIFVNSAVPVRALRVEQTLTPLFAPPDLVQGHGRIQVENVIDFFDSFSLYVVDDETEATVESGGTKTYVFRVTNSSRPLEVTLAWIDPPNSYTARKQLLHDLDLVVTDEEGTVVYHPNGLPGPDEKNNVEKIVIDDPMPQVYRICVTAGQLSEADRQRFALAVTAIGLALPPPSPPSSDGTGKDEQGEGGSSGLGGGVEEEEEEAAAAVGKLLELKQQAQGQVMEGAAAGAYETAAQRRTTSLLPSMSSAAKADSPSTPHNTESLASVNNYNNASYQGGWGRGGELELAVLPLEEVLDPCFTYCLPTATAAGTGSRNNSRNSTTGGICRDMGSVLGVGGGSEEDCIVRSCSAAALSEARQLCLGYGCDFSNCGVTAGAAGADSSKKFKVEARIILRGIDVDSFNTTDVSSGLTKAVSRWLQLDQSSVRVEHVNGYRLETDGGGPRRRLFVSRMLPQYGVEVGLSLVASGRQECSALRSRMLGSYGHLSTHLHQVGHSHRHRVLRQALVFDMESHVVTYRLLPGGIAYDVLVAEEEDDDDNRRRGKGGKAAAGPGGAAEGASSPSSLGMLLLLVGIPVALLSLACHHNDNDDDDHHDDDAAARRRRRPRVSDSCTGNGNTNGSHKMVSGEHHQSSSSSSSSSCRSGVAVMVRSRRRSSSSSSCSSTTSSSCHGLLLDESIYHYYEDSSSSMDGSSSSSSFAPAEWQLTVAPTPPPAAAAPVATTASAAAVGDDSCSSSRSRGGSLDSLGEKGLAHDHHRRNNDDDDDDEGAGDDDDGDGDCDDDDDDPRHRVSSQRTSFTFTGGRSSGSSSISRSSNGSKVVNVMTTTTITR